MVGARLRPYVAMDVRSQGIEDRSGSIGRHEHAGVDVLTVVAPSGMGLGAGQLLAEGAQAGDRLGGGTGRDPLE